MRRTGFCIAAALVVVGTLSGCGSATSSNSGSEPKAPVRQSISGNCRVDLTSPVIRSAVAAVPIEPVTHTPWDTNPIAYQGNYNPCATLSAVVVPIADATGSSPEIVLLFHKDTYRGTATAKAYAFTTIAPTSTDDTVVVDYKIPGSCNACPDATQTQATFHWNGNAIDQSGHPPPA